mmetsp:Transcript_27452/g.54865  ORF Transcript_27452/g.54865 Transcript_27452/m.54865 type:complete len:397 (+) Transcript_27452:195-1385(+)
MADFLNDSGVVVDESGDESSFVVVSSNPQGEPDEAESDVDVANLDVLSEFSLTSESEDDRLAPTFASPSLLRRIRKAEKREKGRAARRTPPSSTLTFSTLSLRSSSPDATLSRHRQLSYSKRAASAPCRVPLTSGFRSSTRSSLAALPTDSDTDASETSVPAPFTAGVLSSNPNDLAASDTPHSALLRNRVDRIRAMKLDGSIVSYIDRKSRQGKSIVEKLRKDEDGLRAFLKGHQPPLPSAHAPPPPPPHSTLSPEERVAQVPKKLLDVVRRVCCSAASNDLDSPDSPDSFWLSLEVFFAAAFTPATEETPTPPPIPNLSTNISSTTNHNTKLSFSMPVKQQNGAFIRIFVHALAHYHGLNSRTYVNDKFKSKVLEVTGPTQVLDTKFLLTIAAS